MDYWKECVIEALHDAGISASDEQIGTIAAWVEGAYEDYGMVCGYDAIPNPLLLEIKDAKEALKEEREKDHSKNERERAENWKYRAVRAEHRVQELNQELARATL